MVIFDDSLNYSTSQESSYVTTRNLAVDNLSPVLDNPSRFKLVAITFIIT